MLAYFLFFLSLSSLSRCKKLEQLYGEVAHQLNGLLLPPDLAHIRNVLNTFNASGESSDRSSRSHTPRIHANTQNTRNSLPPLSSSIIHNRGNEQLYDNRFEDQQLVSVPVKRKLPSIRKYRSYINETCRIVKLFFSKLQTDTNLTFSDQTFLLFLIFSLSIISQ